MNNPYSIDYDIKAERALKHYNNFVHRNISGLTANTLCFNVCPSMERFSPYDVVQVRMTTDDDGNPIQEMEFVELKGRDVRFNDFSDCEINDYKVYDLQKVARESGKDCWLCALYYLDDIIMLWKIDPNLNYEIVQKEALKYTVTPEDGTEKKGMIKFPYDMGYRYKYVFPEELKEQVRKEVEERKRKRRERWIAQNY